MSEEMSQALEVEVLATALRLGRRDAAELLEFLADKLEEALPQATTVTRGGWFLSKKKPVREITVHLGERVFGVTHDHEGRLSARIQKIVKGIAIKTSDVELDAWTDALAAELAELATRSDRIRGALEKFVIG